MPRPAIPTWFYVLVVVRRENRFLLIQETDGDWYLPAGRVEGGEGFVEAAEREALEEGGIPIVLEGILRLQHTPSSDGRARVRLIFVARPADDRPPKMHEDEHSCQAAWVTLEEMRRLPLRGDEVNDWLTIVATGGPIAPLSLLGREM
jgi:phosphatase NudJ